MMLLASSGAAKAQAPAKANRATPSHRNAATSQPTIPKKNATKSPSDATTKKTAPRETKPALNPKRQTTSTAHLAHRQYKTYLKRPVKPDKSLKRKQYRFSMRKKLAVWKFLSNFAQFFPPDLKDNGYSRRIQTTAKVLSGRHTQIQLPSDKGLL